MQGNHFLGIPHFSNKTTTRVQTHHRPARSPFQCPMGMEKAANQARLNLAQKSRSDLIALVNAYEGWRVGKRDFARRRPAKNVLLENISASNGLSSELTYDEGRFCRDVLVPVCEFLQFAQMRWQGSSSSLFVPQNGHPHKRHTHLSKVGSFTLALKADEPILRVQFGLLCLG